jgi:hypothetical protein
VLISLYLSKNIEFILCTMLQAPGGEGRLFSLTPKHDIFKKSPRALNQDVRLHYTIPVEKIRVSQHLFTVMTHIYPIRPGTVIMHSHRRYRVWLQISCLFSQGWAGRCDVIGRKIEKLKLIFMSCFDGYYRRHYVLFLLF